MSRLLVISRFFALLAILGLAPSWAMDSDCCCAPESPFCATTSEQKSLTPGEMLRRLHLDRPTVSTPCAPTSTDDCACWSPGERPSRSVTAYIRPFSEPLVLLSENPTLVLPKVIASIDVPPVATPWRAPVPGLTCWSHALFPLPPPLS